MRRLPATLYLTLAVLLGSAGVSESADFQKGADAYKNKDYATALREWKPLAKQGNADAQYKLGLMYEWGDGVPQDHMTAMKWYKLAAEQEHARAENNLNRVLIKIAKERIKKKKLDSLALIPGFRDLKPGLHISAIIKKEICEGSLNDETGTICYGINNLKFSGTFDSDYFLDKLTVDLGPIVGSVGLIDELATYIQKGETNIYLNMRTALGEKYKSDFEYSERDRQLFNKNEKDKLYTVYEKGQVALLIARKKKKYSHDLWLYIEYRDVKLAEVFFKSATPKRAKKSDF